MKNSLNEGASPLSADYVATVLTTSSGGSLPQPLLITYPDLATSTVM